MWSAAVFAPALPQCRYPGEKLGRVAGTLPVPSPNDRSRPSRRSRSPHVVIVACDLCRRERPPLLALSVLRPVPPLAPGLEPPPAPRARRRRGGQVAAKQVESDATEQRALFQRAQRPQRSWGRHRRPRPPDLPIAGAGHAGLAPATARPAPATTHRSASSAQRHRPAAETRRARPPPGPVGGRDDLRTRGCSAHSESVFSTPADTALSKPCPTWSRDIFLFGSRLPPTLAEKPDLEPEFIREPSEIDIALALARVDMAVDQRVESIVLPDETMSVQMRLDDF